MPKSKSQNRKPARALPRRRFIRNAAFAASAFTIVKASQVRGAAANSKITAGIIGQGGRGQLISRLLKENGNYQLTALADYFPPVAEKAGEQFGVAPDKCFSGLNAYKKLIASGVDAVLCETPPWFFPEHTRAAAAAGKHVYVAKPVAVDIPGTLSVKESARIAAQKGNVFLIDFQLRVDPFLLEVIKRLRAGALGKVGFIRSFYDDNGFSDPALTKNIADRFRGLIWVNDLNLGGSYLVNAGIHAIDVALWLADELPASALGRSDTARPNPHGDSTDVYSITYKMKSGLLINHSGQHYRNLAGFDCRCIAYGEGGHLETKYGGATWMRGGKNPYKGGEQPDLYQYGIRENLKKFHAAIASGDASNPTVEPGINSNLAVILGREAARRQTEITWDQLLRDTQKIEVDLSGLTV